MGFNDASAPGEKRSTTETTKRRWYNAKVHRTASESALMSPQPDAAKAEAYFECACDRALSNRQSGGNCAQR
jgi:hypothetical protein